MLTNGVLPNPSTNLQVQPGTGMNVIVNPGFAVIEGGLKYEETQRTLAVQASDTTYDRIDTVVLRWNDNANARSCDLYVIQGAPASKPVRPALNRESSVYEIGLADLFIAANSSAISSARITDTRYESARCGIISSIAEFDSDTIYEQIQADLAEFKTDEQAQFLAWFETIKDQLSEDAAGNLQLQIDAMKTADTKDNTVSFESGDELVPATFADVELLQSGEKHNSFWRKASLMFKNVRRLISLIGTTDISGIGNGTVTGAISEQNKNIDNITPNTDEIGVFNCWKDNVHGAGFGFTYYGDSIGFIPSYYFEGTKVDLIPNNKNVKSNKKILDIYVDYITTPWRLIFEIYIDGSVYKKCISLNDVV